LQQISKGDMQGGMLMEMQALEAGLQANLDQSAIYFAGDAENNAATPATEFAEVAAATEIDHVPELDDIEDAGPNRTCMPRLYQPRLNPMTLRQNYRLSLRQFSTTKKRTMNPNDMKDAPVDLTSAPAASGARGRALRAWPVGPSHAAVKPAHGRRPRPK